MTRRDVALAQGVYYLVSGLWPIVSMRTFQWVTGPKKDGWLVRMVGLLAATIGGVLVMRASRAEGPPPDPALAIGSAASFAAIDVVYVLKGRISPVYLGDAIVEAALIGGWLLAPATAESGAPRRRPARWRVAAPRD